MLFGTHFWLLWLCDGIALCSGLTVDRSPDAQAAINLFLGNFVPVAGKPALWDLDSDYYLHYSSGDGAAFYHSMWHSSCMPHCYAVFGITAVDLRHQADQD